MAGKDGARHRRCAVCRNPAQAETTPPASPPLRSCAKTSRRAGSEKPGRQSHRKCRRCLRAEDSGAFGTDQGKVRFEQGVHGLQALQADFAFVCGEAAERCKASWLAEQAS